MTGFGTKSVSGWPKPDCSASLIKPLTQAPVDFSAPFDYATTAAFQAKVDNSVAGQMRDCAECHVGGGMMEYIPKAGSTDLAITARQPLRTATLTGVNAFNYFIDQYDENNNGVLGEVLPQDYADTGVIEMDCLICHLQGYDYGARKEAIRKGRFDASRAIGAGIGTVIDANLDTVIGAGDGNQVAYDPAVIDVNTSNELTLGMTGLNILARPLSENCAPCHASLHAVDWKKRGDSWTGNYMNDVHSSIGCLGCHSRKDTVDMNPAIDGNDAIWTGKGSSTVLGHDPAKGNAPYSSLWNGSDNTMKTCKECHIDQIAGNYGAVNPTAKHDALGLTATLVQDGRDGVRDASHLDIIMCEACHIRKLGHGPTAAEGGETHGSLYEWGTGGAMVDSTGPDAEGRVTDHENLYVERTMENNLAYAWQGNKIRVGNALTTMFWRDKDEDAANAAAAGYVDINADGQTGGMDPVNPSHLRDALDAAGLNALTLDGEITGADIAAQRAALKAYLPTVGINLNPNGTGAQDKLKLSFMGVLFKVNHNISPARNAWGNGGCGDCHGDNRGFYNGSYELKPRDLKMSWDNTGNAYVVPFTKVNESATDSTVYQLTDFHPTLFAKGLKGRSIPVNAAHGMTNTLRAVDRSEFLYEPDPAYNNGPGPRTMVDGTVAANRAEIVANLNSIPGDLYNSGVHATHLRIENSDGSMVFSCTTCHNAVSTTPAVLASIVTNWDSAPAWYSAPETVIPVETTGPGTCNKWAVNTDPANTKPGTDDDGDGIDEPGEADYVCIDLVPGVPTGRYTCATQCHGVNSPPPPAPPKVVAELAAVNDPNESFVVKVDAGNSYCEGASGCSYSFTATGGTVLANLGSYIYVQYPDVTTRTVSVVVTDIDSTDTDNASVDVTPADYSDPQFDGTVARTGNPDFTCTVTGTAQGTNNPAVRGYIYWGNGKRSVFTKWDDLAAGIVSKGVCGTTVRVRLIDADYIATDVLLN